MLIRGYLMGLFLRLLMILFLMASPIESRAAFVPSDGEGGSIAQTEQVEDSEADPVDASEHGAAVEAVEMWGALVMSSVFFSGGAVVGVLAGEQFYERMGDL